jgi:uncharacterized protein (TIGR00369 family)
MSHTPPNPDYAANVRQSFTAQSMMRTLGATLEAIEPGYCRIRSPIPEGALQQHSAGHAGLTFSIGDSAAGYAALSLMPEGAEVVTAEIKINLLAQARGDSLVAEGRVLRPGRRLMTVEANVWALVGSERKHIAVLLGTVVPVSPSGRKTDE